MVVLWSDTDAKASARWRPVKWWERLRVFLRLGVLEGRVSIQGVGQGHLGSDLTALETRLDEVDKRESANAAKLLARLDAVLNRLVTCPHCGSVLDADSDRTRKYQTGDGTLLCCFGCRPFLKGNVVKVKGPPRKGGK